MLREKDMALQRAILNLGAGAAFHGGDYTKAAIRAVDDALYHSSLAFLRSLNIDLADTKVTVTIGVQQPDRVAIEAVRALLPPYGQIAVKVVKGGLDVPDPEGDGLTVIASAGIEVYIAV